MFLFGFVLGEFHRERRVTLGREALGVALGLWLEGQKLGNRSILPENQRSGNTLRRLRRDLEAERRSPAALGRWVLAAASRLFGGTFGWVARF